MKISEETNDGDMKPNATCTWNCCMVMSRTMLWKDYSRLLRRQSTLRASGMPGFPSRFPALKELFKFLNKTQLAAVHYYD
jgi:hypothetical protein